jgi:hypothetical protein
MAPKFFAVISPRGEVWLPFGSSVLRSRPLDVLPIEGSWASPFFFVVFCPIAALQIGGEVITEPLRRVLRRWRNDRCDHQLHFCGSPLVKPVLAGDESPAKFRRATKKEIICAFTDPKC